MFGAVNRAQVMTESSPASVLHRDAPEEISFRENALLDGISAEIYNALVDKIAVIHCAPNKLIFEENEAGNALYLIARGSVKISKRGRAGQQETLAYLMEGDFFGEMALVDTGKRSAQAAAVDQVIVGRIDRDGWDLLLQLAPQQLLTNFTRSVTKRLRHRSEHFIEEVMRSERLSLIGSTVSSIVHDLNNPISCIVCACEVIRTNNREPSIAEAAELIRGAVRDMENMTRELIDFSRGNTQLNLEFFPVEELVEIIEADFARYRTQNELRTEAFYNGAIQADRHRLLRVFNNLIRNACEAMAKSDQKLLTFAVKRIDNGLRFEVSDTGCGISPQLLPRIFEPFVTHGKSNGTGLGLAITKAVVEAHNGTISVQSCDRGTTFTVDLPLQA